MDNRWVVPYNPYLSTKYDGHINVEIATSVQSVKYLYKYIYKGHDRALWQVTGGQNAPAGEPAVRNEIQEFQDGRYIGAIEAVWRTFGFSTGEVFPPVLRLDLHLPGEETMYVRADEDLDVRRLLGPPKTKLTGYFEYVRLNPGDAVAKTLRYVDFPEHYVWDSKHKQWNRRQNRVYSVGRVFNAGIKDMERYCLRLLLNTVKGATSFEFLCTVDGVCHSGFRAAATAMGLLADDAEWDSALQEASDVVTSAASIRELFAFILEFEQVTDPMALWLTHRDALSSDFMYAARRRYGADFVDVEAVLNECLVAMHRLLEHTGKTLADFKLPLPDFARAQADAESRTLARERAYDRPLQASVLAAKTATMNAEQNSAFDAVRASLDAVLAGQTPADTCFFLNGPAGTGKTFVYEALLASERQHGRIALATAASGIAALLLPGGTTAHSRFKIPVRDLNENSICDLPKGTNRAHVQLILEASLLLVDEAPLLHKFSLNAFDRSLRDLTGVEKPFGGKVIVLGGDFRQCLPVVRRGQPADCINACLKRWNVWPCFKILKLTTNMRVLRALQHGGVGALRLQ